MTPLLGRGHGSRSSSRFAGIVSEALLASSSSRTGSPVPGRPTSSCASVMTMATTVMPLSHHQHHQHHASASHGIAAGGGSPRVAVTDSGAYRSSPKPHSSPKMKLRLGFFRDLICACSVIHMILHPIQQHEVVLYVFLRFIRKMLVIILYSPVFVVSSCFVSPNNVHTHTPTDKHPFPCINSTLAGT